MKRGIFAFCMTALMAIPACAEGPLVPGMANVSGYGGMAPTYFMGKKPMTITTKTTVYKTTLPKFHNLYRTSYIFGGSIGYSFWSNFELYASSDYTIARSKNFGITEDKVNFTYSAGHFGAWGFYLGARYYFDMGSKWHPFVGARAGLSIRKNIALETKVDNIVVVDKAALAHRRTVPAGGLSIGFDGPLMDYVNFFVMGEAHWSGRFNSQNRVPYDNNVRSLFTVPLVAGVRLLAD